MKRYYDILELMPGATPQEVKTAYRDLAKVWHPDRFGDSPRLRAKAAEKLAEINDAYEKIKEYQERQRNRSTRSGGPTTQSSTWAKTDPRAPRSYTGGDPRGTTSNGHTHAYTNGSSFRGDPSQSDPRQRSGPSAFKTGDGDTRSSHTQGPNPAYSSGTGFDTATPGVRVKQTQRTSLTRRRFGTIQYSYGYGYPYSIPSRAKNSNATYISIGAALIIAFAAVAFIMDRSANEYRRETLMTRGPLANEDAADPTRAEQAVPTSDSSAARPLQSSSSSTPLSAAIMMGPDAVPAPPEGYFTLFSHRDDVIALLGRPDRSEKDLLGYGFSSVYLDDDQVIGWLESPDDPLKVILLPFQGTDLTYFTVGSTKDEVLAIQGTPDQYRIRTRMFKYGDSSVYFRHDKVVNWHQAPSSPLNAQLLPSQPVEAEYFTVGSSKDVVLSVQGTPDQFSETTFNYGYSTVTFKDDVVVSWLQSKSSPLKVRIEPSEPVQADFFEVGSSMDVVLAAQGTPDQYSPRLFKYGYSSVSFEDGYVVSWYESAASPLNVRAN